MYARVTRWEGGEADAIRESAERMKVDGESGPPEGVPSTGLLLFTDPESGRSMAIGLFETEENRRIGDETLRSMNPPGDGMGKRVAVENYELSVEFRL